MFGLDYLLSPYKVEDFVADQWGRKAIFIPGNRDKFQNLFTWEDVNFLAAYSPQQGNRSRLVMDKKSMHESEFSRFNRNIMDGATYVLNHLQEKHPNIDDFTRLLSAELNTYVNVNCYVSKPDKQGFDNHYDRHHVFIIALEGIKHWKVYKPLLKQPIELMKGDKGSPPDTDPYLECDMAPGDVLYIPRGHWHYALCKESSIHLTVGPQSRTPVEFLQWQLMRELWGDEFMRTDFPLVEAGEFNGRFNDDRLKDAFQDFRDQVTEKLQSPELFEAFQEYIMRQNPLSVGLRTQFPQLQSIKEDITPTTEFSLPAGQKVVLKYDSAKRIGILYVRGDVVVLEDIDEKVLSATFHQGALITGEKILAACESVGWEPTKKYLLTLLEHGVISLNL